MSVPSVLDKLKYMIRKGIISHEEYMDICRSGDIERAYDCWVLGVKYVPPPTHKIDAAVDDHAPYSAPVDGKYRTSGGYATVKLPAGTKITPAAFPLDRLKLDATGVWSDTETSSGADKPRAGVNGDEKGWGGWSTYEPKPATCEHNWVDVGFQHSKFVCSKCDAEKV